MIPNPHCLRVCAACGELCGSKDWYWGPCNNPECTENYLRHHKYELANPPPKRAKWKGEAAAKCRQKVLLTGMDCLDGQLDLFNT